jgi:hypothetical protein
MLLGWVCITPFLKPYYNIDKVGFEINNYYIILLFFIIYYLFFSLSLKENGLEE